MDNKFDLFQRRRPLDYDDGFEILLTDRTSIFVAFTRRLRLWSLAKKDDVRGGVFFLGFARWAFTKGPGLNIPLRWTRLTETRTDNVVALP